MKKISIFLMFMLSVLAFSQPSTNAPTPTHASTDVISIFSDSYTNVATNYNPYWGQSGTVNTNFEAVSGSGNKILVYSNFNYQGTEVSTQNASAMEYLHIDVWTNNATVLKVSPINNGTGTNENLVEVTLVNGGWSSVDIPKSSFTGMTWDSVFQFKFDAQSGTTPCTVYLDNIYFWKTGTTASADATLSDLKIDGATITGFNGSATTYNYGVPGGNPIPQITTATTTNSSATVTSITQASAIPGNATVLVTAADGTTTKTYTISYFYNSPATAAPTPSHSNVVSLFSGAYTNVNVDTWNTGWSQASYSEVNISGNATKKYTSLGFNGVETTSNPINAGGMAYLHMDVWTPNITTLGVKIVSFLGDGYVGGNGDSEGNVNVNLTAGQWNQLHIPLSDFTAAGLSSLNDLQQFIFTSTPFGSGILFIDNVYFTAETLGVKDIKAKENFRVYPNPVRSGEMINANINVKSLEIYNLVGQKVKTVTGKIISTEGLSKGIYLIKATKDNGEVLTSKLIVN